LKSEKTRHPWEENIMSKVLQLLNKLAKDEEGAALVEYTVLLGIMLVAVVATIGLVGGWVNTKWSALWIALSAN
jgi:pilus assembly protein Flp/PilA